MKTHIRVLSVSSLLCVGMIAGAAGAAERIETEYERSRAMSLPSFDRDMLADKTHYTRTWIAYCSKNPDRGGCETVLRRLKQEKPQAESLSDLQQDPAAKVDSAKR